MTKQWSDIKKLRPVSDSALSSAHLENLAEDFGLALSHLRRGADLTQVELAHRLLVTQPTVSEIERSGNSSVPTVRRYVEAIGARLELFAVFDDGRRVALDPGSPSFALGPTPTDPMESGVRTHRRTVERSTRRMSLMAANKGSTGQRAAASAAKTLQSKSATKAAKSAAGSALSQTKSASVTRKSAGSAAAKTLHSKSASKAAKGAAGSALRQRPSKPGKK